MGGIREERLHGYHLLGLESVWDEQGTVPYVKHSERGKMGIGLCHLRLMPSVIGRAGLSEIRVNEG